MAVCLSASAHAIILLSFLGVHAGVNACLHVCLHVRMVVCGASYGEAWWRGCAKAVYFFGIGCHTPCNGCAPLAATFPATGVPHWLPHSLQRVCPIGCHIPCNGCAPLAARSEPKLCGVFAPPKQRRAASEPPQLKVNGTSASAARSSIYMRIG